MAYDGVAILKRSYDAKMIPFSECVGFVCNVYVKLKLVAVKNESRYFTFCAKQGHSQEPYAMSGCTKNHRMRANYQAAIWRHPGCKS